MKNNLLALLILFVIIISNVFLIIIINYNFHDNNFTYQKISNEEVDIQSLNLAGYKDYTISEKEILMNNRVYSSVSRYDSVLSYEMISLDLVLCNIGDLIIKDDIIGENNSSTIYAKDNLVVIEINLNNILVRYVKELFTDFYLDDVDFFFYQIGDEIEVFSDDGQQLCYAEVIYIDYLSLYEKKQKVIFKLKNEKMIYDNIPLFIEVGDNEATLCKVIDISNTSLINDKKIITYNQFVEGLLVIDNKIIKVSIYLGILYWNVIEVKDIIVDVIDVKINDISEIYIKI